MFLIIFAALIAAGETAKLDRTYLPPVSSATAGGSPESLQLPFSRSNEGSQGNQDIPNGGFVNDHQGVVVEAALAGTRASGPQSGLGGPRPSYGSSDSKVGDAAFRVTSNKYPQGSASGTLPNGEPDLSAFHQRPRPSRPGSTQIIGSYIPNTVKYQNEVGLKKFNYAFETDNGIKISENGIAKNGIHAEGGYSYTGDDGKVYSVVYTAGKNGYMASGSHLPTPHPIPQAILEALEQNARDEAAGVFDDGSYDPKKYNTEYDYSENEDDQYNDRQSNKFGDRPAFAGGFINQNQQAFVTPSFNGHFGLNDASKDAAFSKPDSSKFGSLMQSNDRFGSTRQPSIQNANNLNNQQVANQYSGFSGASHSSFQAKPLSQQNLQEQKPFEKVPFNRPSSYDTPNFGIISSSVSTSQPSTVSLFGLSSEGAANNFGNGINRPSTDEAFQNKFTQDFFSSNQGQPIVQSKPSSPQYSLSTTSTQPSTGYFTGQPTQQFLSTNIQSSQNGRLPGSQFSSSPFSGSLNDVRKNSNQPIFTTPFKPMFPTKQPQTTLTTPLESFGATNTGESFTHIDFNKKEDLDNSKNPVTSQEFTASLSQSTPNIPRDSSTSYTATDMSTFNSLGNRFSGAQTTQSIENSPQTVQSLNSFKQPGDAEFPLNTEKTTYESAQFTQPQGPDHSYIYNRPNKPFNTPLAAAGSFSSSSANSQVTLTLSPQSYKPFDQTMTVSTHAQSQFVQGADFNTPSEFSQTRQDATFIPTEEAMTQNTQSNLINKQTTTSQGSLQPSLPPFKPFGSNTQIPVIPFSEQSSLFSRGPATDPTAPVTSQLSTLISKFDNEPTTSQFDNFNTQNKISEVEEQSMFTSKIPFSPTFSSQESTQLNKDTISNEQTTTYEQTGHPFDEKYSTSVPTSIEAQTGSFNTQRPSTQFGQTSFSITSVKPSSQLNFGSQESYSNKKTTPSQFDQSTQQFEAQFQNKQPTQMSFTTQTQFNNYNTQKTDAQFNTPTASNFDQFLSTNQPSQPNTQISGQFEQKKTTTSAEFETKQQTTTVSETFSSTSSISETQTPTQNSEYSQIYDYTKPLQGLTTPSKIQDKPQFQTNNQFDNQDLLTTQKQTPEQFTQTSFTNSQFSNMNKDKTESDTQQSLSTVLPSTPQATFTTSQNADQSTGEIYDYNKPSTQFDQQGFLNVQKEQPTPFTKPSFNFGNSQFTTNEDKTETVTQENKLTGFPSTQNFFTSTSQSSGQNTEEIYEYNKPSTQFVQQSLINDQKDKPVQFTQSSFNLGSPQFTTNTDKMETVTQGTILATLQNDGQSTGEVYEYNKPNAQFGQQDSVSVQKETTVQFTQPPFNVGSSQFTTKEDKTESVTQENMLTGFLSNQEAFSTTLHSGSQSTGEVYEYNKPSAQFGQQNSLNTQKETPAQFTQPSFSFGSSQFTTKEGKTESVTQENILTGLPGNQEAFSTTLQSNGQSAGEIYEYNKPNTQFEQQDSLSVQKETTSQFTQPSFNVGSSQFTTKEDRTESVTQENMLTGFPGNQEAFSTTLQSAGQSTGEVYEYNKPSAQFGQQGSLSVQKEIPTQFTQPSFNFGSSQFTTKEDKTESITQENILTGFPVNQEAFSTTLQSGGQSTGEVYGYKKPEQTLSTSPETDRTTQFEQKIQSTTNISQENLFTNQPTTPQFGQTMLSVENTQNTEDFTSTTTLQTTEKPRLQLAFHSSCCGFKKPLDSNLNSNELDKQILEPEKASSFKGVGEQFPSSRKPPSFDESGYHY